MFLSRVIIENFRAIPTLDFSLDETTVLVGENGAGKTSLLRALERCLGVRADSPVFRFEPHDFRPPPGEGNGDSPAPIRIRLVFVERHPDEWPQSHLDAVGTATTTRADGRRQLDWEVSARWEPAHEESVCDCRFLGTDDKPIDGVDHTVIVAGIRRLAPFLIFDEVERHEPADTTPEAFVDSRDPTLRDLERITEEIYGKLSGGWEELSPAELRLGRAVGRRIWNQFVAGDGNHRPYRPPSGGAQSLGPLLVFGAMLRARHGKRLDPEGQPIFAMEHIEARLHPSTLGSIWRVLDQMPLQKIVSTYSGEMLSAVPLRSLRRLVRRDHRVDVYRLRHEKISADDMRRIGYHIRARRGNALFDRCWLLVEGETEFWLLPEMARLCGYDFNAEGIACVEFAQCGIGPIVRLANDLGIRWHLVADGDTAGNYYADAAAGFLNGAEPHRHITRLPEKDIERYLFSAGYARVYRDAAGKRGGQSGAVIQRAIRARPKPFLALSVVEAAAAEHSPGVPPVLRRIIDTAVELARAV